MNWNNIYIKSNFIKHVIQTLSWISKCFNLEYQTVKNYTPLFLKLDKIILTRGYPGLIIYVKALRSAFLNYLSGNIIKVEGIGIYSDGLPKDLGFLRDIKLKEGYLRQVAITLTVLYSTRSLNAGRQADISSIISPAQKEQHLDFGEYHASFFEALGIRPCKTKVPRNLIWKNFHCTTNQGPNGQAVYTCLSDLVSLPDSLLSSLKVLGGCDFSNRINLLLEATMAGCFKDILPCNKGSIRKLSSFPDKELKVRTIAIMDYWSQTVLKPLHSYIFSIMKRIPQDCTFDQGSFKEKLSGKSIFYSIDLTAATDRFPIALQASLLKSILPSNYVDSWVNIMVGYPFEYQQKGKAKEMLSYQVGNPMGAYSSFNVFTLSHHFIVYCACERLKVDWRTLPYCLLGDDIVIANKEVAEEYISIIKLIGVDINISKTHKSSHFYEFAKRYVYNNEEITHFPISSIKSCKYNVSNLVGLLLDVENKGWIINMIDCQDKFKSFYSIVYPRKKLYVSKLATSATNCEIVMQITRNISEAASLVSRFCRSADLPDPNLTDEVYVNVLQEIMLDLFTSSNPENTIPKSKNLGDFAIRLVMYLTSPEFEQLSKSNIDGSSLVICLPHLAIYSQVEEQFLRLKTKAIFIDTMKSGEWPLILNSMMLPVSDLSIYSNNRIPDNKYTARISKLLIEKIKILNSYPFL